jgi:hypothetical protein
MQMKQIPHLCWTCKHCFGNSGDECNIAHYNGGSPYCLSWEWCDKPDVMEVLKKRKIVD